MNEQTLKKKEKKLKHVYVYDQLYHFIQEGIYPPGSQLPSEPDLAEQLHVSRMTLRRALALLQEDHLVKNIRGKGNFICEASSIPADTGMENLQHPIYGCCSQTIDDVEVEFRIEPPTDSISQALGQKTAAVVITDRWYRCNEKVSVYSLSFIPIEVISQKQIDLNNLNALKNYMETEVYEFAQKSICSFSYTTTGNFTAVKYTLSSHSAFILIQENVYGENEETLISSKHYIPVDLFNMQLNLIKPVHKKI